MADPARSSQKNHGGGNFLGQNHGIVARAAHHAMRLAASLPDRLFDFIDEERIHRHCRLTQENLLAHGQTAPLRNFFRLANQIVHRAGSNLVQRRDERRESAEPLRQ